MSDFQASYWVSFCHGLCGYILISKLSEVTLGEVAEFKNVVSNYIVNSVAPKWKGNYPLDHMGKEDCIKYCVANMEIQASLMPHLSTHFKGRAYIKMAHFLMLKCYYADYQNCGDYDKLLDIVSKWKQL